MMAGPFGWHGVGSFEEQLSDGETGCGGQCRCGTTTFQSVFMEHAASSSLIDVVLLEYSLRSEVLFVSVVVLAVVVLLLEFGGGLWGQNGGCE
jgi:hypothetical protein